MNTDPIAQPISFLSLRDVIAKTRLSKATIYRKESAGEFPRRVAISVGCVRWLASEVEQWSRERVAQRDAAS